MASKGIFAAGLLAYFFACAARASDDYGGGFDMNRWHAALHKVQNAALAQKSSPRTINAVIQDSEFVPDIIARDKNQSEFVLTLDQYLVRTVAAPRIKNGKKAAKNYRTLLVRTEKKFAVPKNVILAFWGMESDYGAFKSQYKISDAFLTLIYDGRRAEFFTAQLMALMSLADKSGLDISKIHGSWAGAMGHFQFIPTTLAQYGVDGNGDGKIDVINSVGDAMFSAGNFLQKLGYDKKERIVRKVVLPADFDRSLCDARTKKTLDEWRVMGVWGVPKVSKTAGMVCDQDNDASLAGYLTYENFYRIKKWNNSNSYALAIGLLADKLK
ncbi:MAG: lytic murein transglycosylase [Rickettsiales bacterium]|jgi:membrane-bound lytic murein transglycosylase B|nr:lytic murein transglycosylase [Rickettsiales bacterium]